MKSFFGIFAHNWVTHNWVFKLLALVLALLVFYAVRYADELRPRDNYYGVPVPTASDYNPTTLMKGAVDAIPSR